ncbi:MAG: PilZ domain-containing protein [Candidatus Methylomirabilales bacterium]
MPEEVQKQRKAPRVQVYGRVQGQVSARIEAKLVDLSIGGARLEHTHTLHPGFIYFLTFSVGDRTLNVMSRVVWSSVSGTIKVEGGESQLLYRSGVEFLDLGESDQKYLADLIASLGPGGGAASSGLEAMFFEGEPS